MTRADLLAVALVAVTSCQRSDSSDPLASTVDSAGVRITTILSQPSALDVWILAARSELTLTGAETGDSSAFAHVGAARWLSDGSIVVADAAARRLLLFDSSGKFVKALGRAGAGPGEFRSLATLTVLRGDSILTFDASLRRLTVWHPDGGYVRSLNVGGTSSESWPADAWPWRDGRVVVLQLRITPTDSIRPASGVRRWPMRARITLQDTGGRVLALSREFDGMYTGIYESGDTRLPFSNQPFATISRERACFGSGATFAVRYLSADFSEAGELRWPAQREELTQQEVEAVKAETMALAAGRLPPDQLAQRFAMNFDPAILPMVRPAIGRVFVDHNEQLWIERFEATRLGSRLQKPGDIWSVLSPDGVPVARLVIPQLTRLDDVRDGRALVVVRDSLDVQSVAVREIIKQ